MKELLSTKKYELLLLALVLHLFIGIVLQDLNFYTSVIWPINMLLLGVASIGVFIQKGKWKKIIKNVLLILVIALPLCLPFIGKSLYFMQVLSLSYTFFFGFIFYEIIKFLIKPGEITIDVISASACGFLLLLEVFVFGIQFMFYSNPNCLSNVSRLSPANTYIDIVYFCSIVLTSIGFGDITPTAPNTKLLVSFMGILGQFYSVVLVGILVSKFSSVINPN